MSSNALFHQRFGQRTKDKTVDADFEPHGEIQDMDSMECELDLTLSTLPPATQMNSRPSVFAVDTAVVHLSRMLLDSPSGYGMQIFTVKPSWQGSCKAARSNTSQAEETPRRKGRLIGVKPGNGDGRSCERKVEHEVCNSSTVLWNLKYVMSNTRLTHAKRVLL